ncbi:hypothetical protein BH23BAC1_BH23BAC1_17500 [soil metagenome]
MPIRFTKLLIFLSLLLTEGNHLLYAQFSIDLESGAVINGLYNEVRIPGNEGDFFDLEKDFGSDPTFFYRLRLNYTLNNRHTFSVLYAPLAISYQPTSFNRDIFFNGENFTANQNIRANYQFNSYRLTYRYNFVRNGNFRFGAGITAKIRDAAIGLSSDNQVSEKTDFGFVPLINFYATLNLTPDLLLILDGDALVSTQGRAEDIFLGFGYFIIPERLLVKGGYRVLEGGADNDEVYNFTWLNYISGGLILNLF